MRRERYSCRPMSLSTQCGTAQACARVSASVDFTLAQPQSFISRIICWKDSMQLTSETLQQLDDMVGASHTCCSATAVDTVHHKSKPIHQNLCFIQHSSFSTRPTPYILCHTACIMKHESHIMHRCIMQRASGIPHHTPRIIKKTSYIVHHTSQTIRYIFY